MEALLSQSIRIAAFFHAEHVEPTKTFSTQGQWFSGQHPSEQRRSGMIFKSHFTGKKKYIYIYVYVYKNIFGYRNKAHMKFLFDFIHPTKDMWGTSSTLVHFRTALLTKPLSCTHLPCSHSDFIVDSEYRNWPHFKWCLVRRCWTATKGHSHQSGTSLK